MAEVEEIEDQAMVIEVEMVAEVQMEGVMAVQVDGIISVIAEGADP